uniref:Fam188a protein n=1 Tax=Fopius arisanus TaxID=64838 RepID=A0A0C9REG7_9HYME
MAICNMNPHVKIETLKETIATLVGVSAYNTNQYHYGSWLTDKSTKIIVQEQSTVTAMQELPELHKILFYYAKPSAIINAIDKSQVYFIPNVSLEYDPLSSGTPTYNFIVPNKKLLLKWTNKPNCVASPIVLNAIHEVVPQDRTQAFTKLPDNSWFN